MQPGKPARNVAVVRLYLGPLATFPLVLAGAVATNYRGMAERLSQLPGVSPEGGAKAGLAAFGYGFVVWSIGIGATTGGSGSDVGPDAQAAAEVTDTPTVVETTMVTPTPTPIPTPTPTPIAKPTTSPTDAETGEENEIRQVASDTYSEVGLATGVSHSGDTVLFGFSDGNVMIFDETRDGDIISLTPDWSVSHIQVTKDANTATIAWMDADLYGVLDLSEADGPGVQHPGLWDVDTADDGVTVASVSSPIEGPGSVGLSSEGDIQWEQELDEAVGQSVAITDSGDYIAVGAGEYWADGDYEGTPGVKLYDNTGAELWTHETDTDVLTVDVNSTRELVVAGTDDGKTIVLDFDGNVVWQTDEYGGWIALSGDGSTIVTSEVDGTLLAVDAESGDQRWVTDIVIWAAEDISVNDDGSRVLAIDRAGGEVVVVDEGEVIWEESYDVGPAVGAISGDGTTWSVIIQHNDDEIALVEIYRERNSGRLHHAD